MRKIWRQKVRFWEILVYFAVYTIVLFVCVLLSSI